MSTVAWFSGGATSAVACRMALEADPTVRPVFIETGSHHPDLLRFLKDCEAWFGKSIEVIQHHKFKDIYEVMRHYKFINSPYGARCTKTLKQDVRISWEKENPEIDTYVWGFEFAPKEILRAKRVEGKQTHRKHLFPLIAATLTKEDALGQISAAGIELPAMYRLGYQNNNCIGCVKGGMGYWNKIRRDFPEVFEKTALLEREIGAKCLRKYYLDELPPDAGRDEPPLVQDCGSTGEGCEIESSRWFNSRD